MTSYHKSSINLWMSLYSMLVVGCSGPRQYKIDFAKFCVFSEFITTFLLLKYKHSSKKMLAGSFKLFICRNTSSSAHCKVFWWRCIAPPKMIVSIPKTLVWIRIPFSTQKLAGNLPAAEYPWLSGSGGLSSLLASSAVVIIPGTVAVLWPLGSLWPLWPLVMCWRPLAVSVMMHSVSNGMVGGMVGSD